MIKKDIWAGVNEKGENVIIIRGDGFLKTETFQKNGWLRINILYCDGSEEEYYDK